MMKQCALTLSMTFFTAWACQGQDWSANPPGNPINGTEYLGCDAFSTQPLRFTTIPNLRQEWRTNNVLRMLLTESLLNQNWAWYQNNNLDFSGHLGIGNPTPQTPLTYVHINSSALNGITVGYRPWMRVGVFTTQGSDGLYAGMRQWNNASTGS